MNPSRLRAITRWTPSRWLLAGAGLVAAGHVPLLLALFAVDRQGHPLWVAAGLAAVAVGLVAVGIGLVRLAVAFGRESGR